MTRRSNVPPSIVPLTEEDAREILAKPLRKACQLHGPTRVGAAIGGANEKTVRGARDERSTLRIDYAANLLLLDGLAFDGFLARVNRRSVCNRSVTLTPEQIAAIPCNIASTVPLLIKLLADGDLSDDDVRALDREGVIDCLARTADTLETRRSKLQQHPLRSARG